MRDLGAGVVLRLVTMGLSAAADGLDVAGLSEGARMRAEARRGEAGGERDGLTATSR